MLCGGTTETKEATEEIQSLVEKVHVDLEAKDGNSFPHFKAVAYKSQIVNGTNYFVKIQVDDDKFMHARIHQALPHAGSTVSFHSYQPSKSREDAIEYF
ncbi:unnamed protein product [Candidula unifasciata]|uniref:Cystatin domain-containing protein n=1 Tax=Candidula unifasciata TaxID=100452 RepID=A0A8S3YTH9_9EUPU|nr:unnamed protein product [Candidula unifasciata]